MALNPATVEGLQSMGITDAGAAFAPAALLFETWTLAWPSRCAVGGMLRDSALGHGCTSDLLGGLGAMQWTSLIAVIGFFIGGLAMTHFVLPQLLPLL